MTELPHDIATSLESEALASLTNALRAFPSFVRGRGEDVALAGRAGDFRRDAHDVLARVRGTRTYAVRWRLSGDVGEPLCSCPVGPICKHAYAVGVLLLAAARREGRTLGPRDLELLPAVMRRAPEEQPPFPDSLRRPRPGAAAAGGDPRLRALREADAPWLRLEAATRLLHLAGFPHAEIGALDLEAMLAEPDADLRCWRLAHAIERVLPGRAPAPLRAFLERADLARAGAEAERHHLVERLGDWASSAPRDPHHLRAVLGLVRLPGGAAVTLQARLTNTELRDAPCRTSRLTELAQRHARDPRLLTPPQARLLRLLLEPDLASLWMSGAEPRSLGNEQLHRVLDRATNSPFVSWSDELPGDLAALGGVTPASRAALEGEELRLTLDAGAGGGGVRLSLALAWPDGRTRPADQAIIFPAERHAMIAHPSIALVEGAFHRIVEEPPPDIVRTLAEMRGVPLRREDGPVLERLEARVPAVANALQALTRTWDARPVVALDWRDGDWLQLRLHAIAGDEAWTPGSAPAPGVPLFEWSPATGWEVVQLPAGGAGEQPWRHVPAPERVAAAREWVERIVETARGGRARGPAYADADRGGWLRLTPGTLEALYDAWQSRPGGVEWAGSPEFQQLLAGDRHARVRVAVTTSGIDWLGVRADWESEGRALTDEDLAALRGSRERFVRLRSGWVRREQIEEQDALAEALADLGIEAGGAEQRVSVVALMRARAESLERLAGAGAPAETLAAVARLRAAIESFSGMPRIDVPAGFRGTLRGYQRDGLDFLVWTGSLGLGAILADDMGLGKTVQALAWLQHLVEREPAGGPALVVCPASVVHNWARESERFTPGLRVLTLQSGRDRHAQLDTLEDYDLVVTNYALLRRDVARWRGIPLRAAILDEAQNIKNPDAAVSRAARELKAKHRLALTGTPLENRALDLWSILAFAGPGHLGPRAAFVSRFDRPDAPPHMRRLLGARLRPVLLRRLKEQVARDLPPRIEERLDCEMTPGQRRLYLAELTRGREHLRSLAADDPGLVRSRVTILALLTKLRQICCHPALVGGRRDLGSGKFQALFELLEPILAEGRKVLVFSQFVECLKLLEEDLNARGVPLHMLTGSTATADREQVVAAFTGDPRPCAFLVSLKAGGTGLNLTAASDVILFDPWWNPAVEAQAIDRTHRIGQDRTVVAYRLYTEGTIEERIADLQRRKASLVRDVLGEEGLARALSRDDLDYLLAD